MTDEQTSLMEALTRALYTAYLKTQDLDTEADLDRQVPALSDLDNAIEEVYETFDRLTDGIGRD